MCQLAKFIYISSRKWSEDYLGGEGGESIVIEIPFWKQPCGIFDAVVSRRKFLFSEYVSSFVYEKFRDRSSTLRGTFVVDLSAEKPPTQWPRNFNGKNNVHRVTA